MGFWFAWLTLQTMPSRGSWCLEVLAETPVGELSRQLLEELSLRGRYVERGAELAAVVGEEALVAGPLAAGPGIDRVLLEELSELGGVIEVLSDFSSKCPVPAGEAGESGLEVLDRVEPGSFPALSIARSVSIL